MTTERDPKIYLAVDNCFASKRWTRPAEWMELIGDLGIHYIEASADNECDPLYSTAETMSNWLNEADAYCKKLGVQIANFYSGHGTYATLGLGHTDHRIRDKIQNNWVKTMAFYASRMNAGLGFYCHAFPDSTLQNIEAYKASEADLYSRLADISQYCHSIGAKASGVEQMYTPHQQEMDRYPYLFSQKDGNTYLWFDKFAC